MAGKTRIGLYPGTFDPVTLGHLDIIKRAVKLVDHLVIGVATNSSKEPLFTLQERKEMLEREAQPLAKDRATIEVRDRGKFVAMLYPETRSYPAEGQAVTKTAIHTTGFSDLYVALGDDRGGGRYVIRAYVNPLAPFIWFGGAVMALGGLASLVGRLRLRVVRLAPAE